VIEGPLTSAYAGQRPFGMCPAPSGRIRPSTGFVSYTCPGSVQCIGYSAARCT
jgi:hypothetical protein